LVTCGRGAGAAVRADAVVLDVGGRLTLGVVAGEAKARVATDLLGAHHAPNVLAALAAGLAAGIPLAAAAAALVGAGPDSPHRLALSERPDGTAVLDDAYPANPASAGAALAALAALARRDGRPAWAVLGEMRELGDASEAAHRELGRQAAGARLARLVVVGDGARPIADGARLAGMSPEAVEFFPGVEAAEGLVAQQAKGTIILIKGSQGTGLWRLASRLAEQRGEVAAC
jgi:UDP-N-acetylmuramoyl-tripeptide--D-alanyl-D-alanine ligase